MHPQYLVTEESREILRLARCWREGMLPAPGGVQDQLARTVASVEIVLAVWSKLQAAQLKKQREF